MSRSPIGHLRHILDEAIILEEQARRTDREAFLRDRVLQRAFVRSIEVIGEATKKIPAGFRNAHQQIEWRAMAGMRDRLIHD